MYCEFDFLPRLSKNIFSINVRITFLLLYLLLYSIFQDTRGAYNNSGVNNRLPVFM